MRLGIPARRERRGGRLFVTGLLALLLPAIRTMGAEAGTVRNFGELYGLPQDQIAAGAPVDIEATVLYFDPAWNLMYLQDSDSGKYFDARGWSRELIAGQRIRLTGRTRPGGGDPDVWPRQAEVLNADAAMPVPQPHTIRQLHEGASSCRWVETEGTVQWTDVSTGMLTLRLVDGKERIDVLCREFAPYQVTQWLGSRIKVAGVSSCDFKDGKPVGSRLFVPRKENLVPLKPPAVHPFQQPVRAIASLRKEENLKQVNLVGMVRSQQPGVSLVVRDDTGEVRVETDQVTRYDVGTVINVVGRPEWNARLLVIRDAVIVPAAEVRKLPTEAGTIPSENPDRPPITSVQAVRALPLSEAARLHPVLLRGVVTCYIREWFGLFVQDETAGVYVTVRGNFLDVRPGDEVEIRGVTDPGGFAPMVQAESVVKIREAGFPESRLYSVQELLQGSHDSRWVEVRGVVRSIVDSEQYPRAVATDQSGAFKILVPDANARLNQLLDSVVTVRGVVASEYNDQRELVGVEIRVPEMDLITVENPAPEDPFSLPPMALSSLRQFKALTGPPGMRKVAGTVTLVRPNGSFNIQAEDRGLLVVPRESLHLQAGDKVEVVGYPEWSNSGMVIQGGRVRIQGVQPMPPPIGVTERNLLSQELDQLWVQAQGKLIGQSRRREGLVSLIQIGGWVLEACSPLVDGMDYSAPPIGSVVRVTGVLDTERDILGNVRSVRVDFRDARLMEVMQRPGWWTDAHTQIVLGLLLIGLLLTVAWGVHVVRTNRRLQSEIAERHRTERRLAQEQYFLNALMENSPDIIYFKDLKRRFLRVNRTGASKHGFKNASEMVGKTDRDLFGDQPAAEFEEDEQFVIRTGRPIVAKEEKEIMRDGREFWVQTTTMPFYDSKGDIAGIIGISRDITQRKLAEIEMARQRHDYQVMFDAMPAMVVFKDTCNRNLRVNRYAADLIGLPPAEIEGRSLFELDPEHADRSYADDLEVIHSGEPKLGIEEIIGTADGRTRWIRTDKLPHRNPEGGMLGLVVFSVDITDQKLAEQELRRTHDELEQKIRLRTAKLEKEVQDRKKAEERLQENERFFRAIIDVDPNLIFVKDSQGRFTLVNEAVYQFTGLKESEIIGRTDAEITPDQEIVRAVQRDDADIWLSGREKFIPEEKNIGHGGQVRWWQTMKRPLFNDKKEMVFLVGVSMDITERRRKEQELRKTQSFLNSVVQNLPITVFLKEANELRFVMWNKAGEALTGYTNEEMVGKNDFDFYSRETAEKFIANDRQTLESGKLLDVPEEVLETRHKGRRIMHTRKIPIVDADGKPTHLLGITEDITDQKLAAQELENTKNAAEAANRSKSEFLATMSHEIRTPMNAVIGMTNLLLSTRLDEAQRDFARTARNSAEALLTIINDILDFSKIEAGKLECEKLDFELRDVVDSTVDMVSHRAVQKGIELGALIPQEIEHYLRGDSGRIRQVLLNLLGNAVKFTETGEVALDVSEIARTETRVTLRFAVTDTGIGIPPEIREKLFQPFTQADGSTTRRYGGTGLGLVISKQLVEIMGGEMGMESLPGAGSTFWFTLPLDRQPPSVRANYVRLDNLRGLRVLVVDDNEINRRIIHHHILAWTMNNGTAESGPEALERLRAAADAGRPYDIAILDMAMPDMDGLMLARAIKQDERLRPTVLIMLTSLGQVTPAEELRQAGIAACMVKPLKQSDLYDCLINVLSGESGTEFRTRRRTQTTAVEAAPPHHPVRILVAEDNPVNQKVAVHTLNKLGYHADCVANGLEAVSALDCICYDVILMDCNMPEMDGYEATRTIRTKKLPKRPHIIAMTANAMVGDREKCLAAGMDHYIAKPVRESDLNAALISVIVGKTAPPSDETVDIAQPTVQRINAEAIARLKELDDDDSSAILKELVGLYLTDSTGTIGSLQQACAIRDRLALAKLAHALKGSSRNVGADEVAGLASELEAGAAQLTEPELDQLVAGLVKAHALAVPELEAIAV